MAILHKATLKPTKDETIARWLDSQPWAPDGETKRVGSYRFDDPDGEVGVEGFVIQRGDSLLHVPVTYRDAPLEGGDAGLMGKLHHSVLGDRWVYDAAADPVAIACFVRALRGEQEPASLEVYDGDELLERKESGVEVRTEDGAPEAGDNAGVVEVDADGATLRLSRVVGAEPAGSRRLIATWADGSTAVAALA